ncbi:uL14 family ribosomal protein [Candidatus Woesearchaeota archaeon]|nr:uL14 family ribosomal protein [Candidatus Woesearchaeota archaeon]
MSCGLQKGSKVATCDNSGAKRIRIISTIGRKNTKGKNIECAVGDLIMASVINGSEDMLKQVVYAIIVRQRKEWRRPDGTRIHFEDNAAVVLKDEKGNPKGTIFKGAIAKEVAERWPSVSKLATILV